METMDVPLLAPVGHPDAVALTDGTTSLTYAELVRRSAALAAALADAGLRTGDRVATLGANSIAQVVLFHACARAGLVLAPLSWRAAPSELAAMLEDADPALLVADLQHQDLAARAAALLDRAPTPALMGPGGLEHEVPRVRPTGASGAETGDAVLLLYTSGSSGRPKGVLLGRSACRATTEALAARFPLTAEDVVLLVLPQFHVAAWNVQTLQALGVGARVVVVPDFDAGTVLALLQRERVTAMMGVPTTYQMLAEHPAFPSCDLSRLRLAVVGGAPVDHRLSEAWGHHGVRIWAGYGLTEAGPNVLCEPPSATAPTGWLEPYPGVSVRLDERGQLLVRSPGLFHGYWRDPTATARAFVDGWLATGDLADERDGRFRLRGRSSEKYITGGENVHPAEVERALRLLDAVAEAAVVGVPDERWGEAGLAFVVPAPGHDPRPEQLRRELREHLAGFKVPRDIVVVPSLPQTATGKIDKRSLRAQAEEQQ
ncbi:class I adenylate-forming enzyme family protein [Nocardioides panaciterrulae]|uniref:Fatty-acyl-CoA synthase n=1 Tax=Nocardioides panaciterrulae TaxID=661492 RepID=A0A7Y9JAP3_9ACTN|nr:AMP-binding protein [Nocardioides panaciterrulae]NYD41331.1 fatty-acyl-CoA synthase [Nocardioides panaciterrulae]